MILINSSSRDDAGIFQPFLPIYLPMGAGYLLAVCDRENIPVHFIDQQIEDDVWSRMIERIPSMKAPYIFGFSVLTAGLAASLSLAARLKEQYPDSVVIFGGIHATAMPEECLAQACVDIVVRGEAENTLPELYRRLKSRGDWQSLDGISYRGTEGVVHRPRAQAVDLDTLPLFPYHRFDPSRYVTAFVMSSRGCPYECIFCSNQVATGKRYRFRSTGLVIQEIGILVEQHHVRRIHLLDDNFLVNHKRVRELIKEIKQRGWHHKVTFDFQCRGDNIDPQLMRELFEAGFVDIGIGIETASEDILKRIKKGETLGQIMEAIRLARSIGFDVASTVMFGLPGETHTDRIAAMRLVRELDLDKVKFNNAIPYPGTEFFDAAKRAGQLRIEGWYSNFNAVGTFVDPPWRNRPLPYVPEGSSDADVRDDILWAYWNVWFNPHKIWRMFRNSNEDATWFRTGATFQERMRKVPILFMMVSLMAFKYAGLFIRTPLRRLMAALKRA
jgi:radical SAM superfamily enzyme YgiQ (UPF0313 family)